MGYMFVFCMLSIFFSMRVLGGVLSSSSSSNNVYGIGEVFNVMMEGVVGDGRIDDGEVDLIFWFGNL